MHKILMAFGTRPEAVKLAPVHRELLKRADRLQLVCCVTGQHRELLTPFLTIFNMVPQYDLRLFKENQDLFDITVGTLQGMRSVLLREKPHLLVVQGDTTSAFSAALSAFYLKTPVAHVEAGLRSYQRFQPYPEEINRRFVSHLADLHFCPTERSARQLMAEQIAPASIATTGNTAIDALMDAIRLLEAGHEAADYPRKLALPHGRTILATCHRRENFGKGLTHLSLSLLDLVQRFPDVNVVFSVHPNPNVRSTVKTILGSHERIRVIIPPDYFEFVALMREASFIITDSGGIQEEAPSLRKPVLVARTVTERPEAVESGVAVLVGTDRARIVEEASHLLQNPDHYASMVAKDNPFGDGRAAARIADRIEGFLRDRAERKER